MARKPVKPRIKADLSLLPPEEIAELRRAAEDRVLAERQEQAREAAIEQFIEEARLATSDDPEDEMVDVFIDLPEFTDRLVVDGVTYLFGRSYRVSSPKAASLYEMMGRAADHQAEVDGKSKFRNKVRNMLLSPRRGQIEQGAI